MGGCEGRAGGGYEGMSWRWELGDEEELRRVERIPRLSRLLENRVLIIGGLNALGSLAPSRRRSKPESERVGLERQARRCLLCADNRSRLLSGAHERTSLRLMPFLYLERYLEEPADSSHFGNSLSRRRSVGEGHWHRTISPSLAHRHAGRKIIACKCTFTHSAAHSML